MAKARKANKTKQTRKTVKRRQTAQKRQPKQPMSRIKGTGLFVIGTCLMFALVVMGMRLSITCDRIEIGGNEFSTTDDLLTLARVETGGLLYEMDSELIADRIRRNPWIRKVDIRRWPSGTMAISVKERTPVAAEVSGNGKLAYLLDREGFRMPMQTTLAVNLPIVRFCKDPYVPTQPIADQKLRSLLGSLAHRERRNDPVEELISEILADTERGPTLILQPAAEQRRPVTVKLGRSNYDDKLKQVRAVWEQLLTKERGRDVRTVDLRINGQIVTA